MSVPTAAQIDVPTLLQQLVQIPSQKPDGGAPWTGAGYLETELTSLLEQLLTDWGLETERQTVEPGRDNLLAWLPPSDPHDETHLVVGGPSRHGANRWNDDRSLRRRDPGWQTLWAWRMRRKRDDGLYLGHPRPPPSDRYTPPWYRGRLHRQ